GGRAARSAVLHRGARDRPAGGADPRGARRARPHRGHPGRVHLRPRHAAGQPGADRQERAVRGVDADPADRVRPHAPPLRCVLDADRVARSGADAAGPGRARGCRAGAHGGERPQRADPLPRRGGGGRRGPVLPRRGGSRGAAAAGHPHRHAHVGALLPRRRAVVHLPRSRRRPVPAAPARGPGARGRARRADPADARGARDAVAAAGVVARTRRSSLTMARNLLFLMADQLGAHALEGASQEFLATPHLSRLRAEGTAFTRAYTPFPLCVPARSALMAGRAPHEIGIDRNRPTQEVVDRFCAGQTLPQALQAQGVRTEWGGKWHAPRVEVAESDGFALTRPFGDVGLADWAAGRLHELASRYEPFALFVSFDDPHTICEYARGQPMPYGDIEPVAAEDA